MAETTADADACIGALKSLLGDFSSGIIGQVSLSGKSLIDLQVSPCSSSAEATGYRTRLSFTDYEVEPLRCESAHQAPSGRCQIARQFSGHGLAATNYLCVDHSVSTSHLKLDGPNQSRNSGRFEVPCQEICCKCWNVSSIDELQLRTRRHFKT